MKAVCGRSISHVKKGWVAFEETACLSCEWLEKDGNSSTCHCTYNSFYRRIPTMPKNAPCLKNKGITNINTEFFINIEPKYRKFKAPAMCGKLDCLSMQLLEKFMKERQKTPGTII